MSELILMRDKSAVTTSLTVAEVFGKKHKHVLRDIQELEKDEFFVGSEYTNSRGRDYPMYYMTKEGFLLLTASYRGKDVLKKKLEILKNTDMIPPSLPERKELEFFEDLKEALQPIRIQVEEQYPVLNYRVDGYIESLNLAIEYDEVHHVFKKHEDELRQKEITHELGCKFIRLPECNSNARNIGIVFREIMKMQIRKAGNENE